MILPLNQYEMCMSLLTRQISLTVLVKLCNMETSFRNCLPLGDNCVYIQSGNSLHALKVLFIIASITLNSNVYNE